MARQVSSKPDSGTSQSSATIGFEAKLWLTADKLRSNMDAACSLCDQDKWARRQRPFGLAKRARRLMLRRQQPKQSNATTRRLAIMNLAIRGIEAGFGKEHADNFCSAERPSVRTYFVCQPY